MKLIIRLLPRAFTSVFFFIILLLLLLNFIWISFYLYCCTVCFLCFFIYFLFVFFIKCHLKDPCFRETVTTTAKYLNSLTWLFVVFVFVFFFFCFCIFYCKCCCSLLKWLICLRWLSYIMSLLQKTALNKRWRRRWQRGAGIDNDDVNDKC